MTSRQRRHLVVQVARRLLQGAVVVAVLGLIFLGLYDHYRASRRLDEIAGIPGWRGAVLRVVDHRMAAVEDPETFLSRNGGNLWCMRVAGFDVCDPLAFAEATAARTSIHRPLLIAVLVPVLVALLLGRVFCSWMCPGYVVFEIAGKLRRALQRAGVRLPVLAVPHRNKYVFLAVGLLIAAVAGSPLFSLVYPPALLSRVAHAVIFGSGLVGMLAILFAVVAVELFVAPRWWCRTMCPGGALYGLLGAVRPLRVRVVRGACSDCRLCEPVCEMGLNPIAESSGIECDNCAVCLRYCPDDALEFRVAGHATRA